MKNNKTAKFMYIYLIIQPIIDLLTSVMVRFNDTSITVGIITRGLFLVLSIVYLIFFNKSIYKKKSIIYLIILFLLSILYFVFKPSLLSKEFFKFEITYMFKYAYFPIITVCMLNIFDEIKLEKQKIFKIFCYNVILYSILILIPEFSGTSFSSYTDDNLGSVGWFYAANEIGAILVALFPHMYYFLHENANKIKTIILFIIVILAMTILGTKTAFLGMLITEILYLIYYFVTRKNDNKVGLKFSILLIVLSFVLIPNIPAVKNLEKNFSKLDDVEESIDENYYDNNNTKKIAKLIFSDRDKFYFRTLNIYKKSPIQDKLLGIGFSDRPEINNSRINKLIEMDPLDVFFHYGVIFFIAYLIPLLYIIYKTLKQIFRKKNELTYYKITNIYTIIITLFISFIAGHVFGAPGVSIYLALFIAMLDSELRTSKNHIPEKNKKEITFFLLHLGYGGIESSVINQANTLIEDYDIKIISFYKLKKNQEKLLDTRAKVKYLYDGEPNREEFKKSLQEHKFLKTLKEGLKAVDILIKKKVLVINSIIDCDSEYIISTRYEFNKLLSKYGNKNSIKIAEEHHYHNNDQKYINILSNKYNNIDYLFALTKTLEEDYKKFLKNNNHTKVVLVPNMLYDIPTKTSKLNEKNILAIGRLDYGKKNDDIIRAFSKIEDKDWKLYILGDGKEMENLSKLIEELKLKDRVFLEGYKNKQEIEEYMLKSSIFLMASITEGLPMVLLEAMSYGLPCIAYETESGTKDIILDNINGYVIKNRNEKEYVKKLNKLISDEKLRKKFGKNAKETSKKFSKDEIKKKLNNILK